MEEKMIIKIRNKTFCSKLFYREVIPIGDRQEWVSFLYQPKTLKEMDKHIRNIFIKIISALCPGIGKRA